MKDWKMTDQISGQENAGLENERQNNRAGKCMTGKWKTENAGLENERQENAGLENERHEKWKTGKCRTGKWKKGKCRTEKTENTENERM